MPCCSNGSTGKTAVSDRVQIAEDDLQKFESSYGKRVEVMAIVLNTQRQANMVWDLANNNSTDYFLVNWLNGIPLNLSSQSRKGSRSCDNWAACRRRRGIPLKERELSGIVAVGGKYIIMRCTGHTVPVVESIEDVKELISYLSEREITVQ